MKIQAIIKEVLANSDTVKNNAQLGRLVGIENEKNPSDVIGKRLRQKNLSVDLALEMLDVMGYTLVAVPKGKNLKDGEFEVTGDE